MRNELHLNSLDEFLASALLDRGKTIKLAIKREGTQGCVSINLLKPKDAEVIEESGVDFELSPCECSGLDGMDAADFLGSPVFTSSAYEFFDFMFMFFDAIECLADFDGNTWKVKVINHTPISD